MYQCFHFIDNKGSISSPVGIKHFHHWLKIVKDLACFNPWPCKNAVTCICIKCMVEPEEVDNLDALREVA